MAEAKRTTDHQKIKSWVEERGGKPAAVKGTRTKDDPGILRIDFPGYRGDESLQEISWEEFFEKFEKEKLAFLYQEETAAGDESRFSKVIGRENLNTEESKPTKGDGMNAFELLKEDHKKVAGLLGQISETTERALKTRDELFAKVNSELEVHTRIEEEIFYPALKEADETRDLTLEAFEEHRLVKQLLKELSSGQKGTEQWTAKFTVLKENIEHHVEEEEGEMFKKARKVLSKEEIEKLGERMAAAKERLASAKTA